MKYIPVAMVREHMQDIPTFDCPAGYRIRTFVRGDEQHWARIETSVGEFTDQKQALQLFTEDYGSHLSEMEDRSFLLETDEGEAVGTATAWYRHFAGEERGRVSWVAIMPEYQGKQLAKPLLSAVMTRLARDHQKAFLTTQTTSYRAVNMYLAYGFVPYFMSESCQEGWSLIEQALERKLI